MTTRNRNALAALLAAGLIVLSGISGAVLAHGGGRPSGSPWPSGQPQPSGQLQPSFQASHMPMASHSMPAKPSHAPGGIDCSNLPVPSPAASAAPSSASGGNGFRGQSGMTWGWRMGPGWLGDLDQKNLKACTADSLAKGIDGRIARLIATLNDAKSLAGKIKGLDSTQQAALVGEIDGAIADLKALQTKIDGEPKGPDLQADLKALQKESFVVRAIVLQVRLLDMAENTLAKISALDAEATALAAQIAAAPSGVDTTQAQRFLTDMKARIADAQKLATALPGTLLGLTSAQLQAGKADPIIAGAIKATWQAAFDVFKATQDGRMVKFFLTKSV